MAVSCDISGEFPRQITGNFPSRNREQVRQNRPGWAGHQAPALGIRPSQSFSGPPAQKHTERGFGPNAAVHLARLKEWGSHRLFAREPVPGARSRQRVMLTEFRGFPGRLTMISREELYQLVWSKPMTKVAEQFGVSGSYMTRVCTMLNVPRPGVGYWAKLAFDKAPPPTPLPEARPGDTLFWSQGGQLPPPQKPQAPRRPRKRQVQAAVPKDATHEMIRGAKSH